MQPIIGQPARRKEDRRFITGEGRFTDDIDLPGQVHACFVRSPHAHAHIVGMDIASARDVPGVLGVLTGQDYGDDGLAALDHLVNGVDHFDLTKPAFAPETLRHDPLPPHFPIACGRVRHIGEIVAVALGETAEAARDAAERVELSWEALPALTDGRAAAAADAYPLWEDGNVCVVDSRGDREATDAAFAAADHVVRLTAHNHRVSGAPMEPRAAIGDYDSETGIATLHAPSQGVHRYKTTLSAALNLPPDRVRILTRDVGGGFGVRSCCNTEYVLLVWASRRIGRPVKWTATRSECFLGDFQARDVHGDGALALDRDGRFLALKLDYTVGLGAYPVSLAVLGNLLKLAGGPYAIPAIHVDGRAVFTSTIPTSVYRGAGRPEVTYMVERLIDIAAAELGVDRVALRRRNMIPSSALPYQSPLGPLYESGAFLDNLDAARDAIGWDGFPDRRVEAAKRGLLSGIGIATYLEAPAGAPVERADIRVLPQGEVEAVIGTQSTGQGHETAFAQVVAEALQVRMDQVSIVFGDSDRAVAGGGSHSDRSMRLGGTVLVRASEDIRARGRRLAAHLLEAAEADIVYSDSRFAVVGTDRSIGLFELAEAAAGSNLPNGMAGPLAAANTVDQRLPAHPNGVAACEVEIDPETGAVEIVRYVTVDDVGRVINPMIVDGQIHGGIAQGVGQALYEQCIYDAETGQFLSGSFLDYCMPRADDLPSFGVVLNDAHPAPSNPLGVKGAGEAGTTPACAAIVGAVVDALRDQGVRHLEMPLTPERILKAIRST